MSRRPMRRRMRLPDSTRRRYWLAAPAVLAAGCVAYNAPSAYVGELAVVPAARVDPAASLVMPLLPQVTNVGGGRTPPPAVFAAVPLRTLTVLPQPPRDRHVVAPGETLIAIARDQLGSAARWRDIVTLNPGLTPTSLSVGQSLVLP